MRARGFRKDLQGIRGLALVLVLLSHAEVPHTAGGYVGLDVFFVLSGFLITGLIVRELRDTGSVSLVRFYARRARRLLPLALTVLAVIAAASLLVLPPVRASVVAGDVIAACLYVVNWRFMAESVDYFASTVAASPVQHYWSLSVEEQFYVVWPLALLLATAWPLRRGRDPGRALWTVVAGLGAVSLAYSISFTAADADQAYFSTAARGWELALGGALALALPAGRRLPRIAAAPLACAGLAAILGAAFVLEESSPYPGWRALAPALGTAALIAAGTAARPSAPVRVLMSRPSQYLGRLSYAMYLWHWPVLVFAIELLDLRTTWQLLAATAVAWVPAAITHRAVEERLRHSTTLARRPRRTLALAGACSVAGLGAGLALAHAQPTIDEAPPSQVRGADDSARLQTEVRRIRPAPQRARHDKGRMFADGCLVPRGGDTSGPCVYGVPDAETTVVLLGDSHALQYFPALERLAHEREWRLVALAKAACPVAAVSHSDACDAWREHALRRIEREERPALVVTSSSTSARVRVRGLDRRASQPRLVAGYAATLERLKRTGARVVVIRDQVRASFDPPECVAQHPGDLRRCAFARERIPGQAFDAAGARRAGGVKVLDPLDVLCRRRRCPSVIGDALVYRDEYHLTATFAATLAPWLRDRLPPL